MTARARFCQVLCRQAPAVTSARRPPPILRSHAHSAPAPPTPTRTHSHAHAHPTAAYDGARTCRTAARRRVSHACKARAWPRQRAPADAVGRVCSTHQPPTLPPSPRLCVVGTCDSSRVRLPPGRRRSALAAPRSRRTATVPLRRRRQQRAKTICGPYWSAVLRASPAGLSGGGGMGDGCKGTSAHISDLHRFRKSRDFARGTTCSVQQTPQRRHSAHTTTVGGAWQGRAAAAIGTARNPWRPQSLRLAHARVSRTHGCAGLAHSLARAPPPPIPPDAAVRRVSRGSHLGSLPRGLLCCHTSRTQNTAPPLTTRHSPRGRFDLLSDWNGVFARGGSVRQALCLRDRGDGCLLVRLRRRWPVTVERVV